jgi:hypothetical protein
MTLPYQGKLIHLQVELPADYEISAAEVIVILELES